MKLYLIDLSYWTLTLVEGLINLILSILLLNRVFKGGVDFSLAYYYNAKHTMR